MIPLINRPDLQYLTTAHDLLDPRGSKEFNLSSPQGLFLFMLELNLTSPSRAQLTVSSSYKCVMRTWASTLII